jgi:hypothetical protein
MYSKKILNGEPIAPPTGNAEGTANFWRDMHFFFRCELHQKKKKKIFCFIFCIVMGDLLMVMM